MNRPNIVFIMTDTQRYDMLGCNGSAFCQTPHLDRLAAGSLNFDKAYTTTPLCTPARAGLFTGMYASSSGAAANQIPLFENTQHCGLIFEKAGYITGHIGKWHLDGPEGGYYGTGKAPEGFPQEWWYDGECFKQDVGDQAFAKWKAHADLQPEECWAYRVADRAEKFISEKTAKGAPFYLIVSFDEPHGPSSAPRSYYARYEGTTRSHLDNMDDDLQDKPALHRAFSEYSGKWAYVPPGERPNNSPSYYGCNTFVDEQIGRVIEAIDNYCPDNTIIVYTSDHGDHAGSHQMISKGPTMYEEITHIPLMIRAPGTTEAGSRCEQIFSHIDIAPTLCDLSGIAIPDQFQGTSRTDLLADPERPGAEAVFMEYNRFGLPHDTRWGFQPIRCVRTDKYKLVLNLTDMDELYDLDADPGEITNLINAPDISDIRDELHTMILRWMDERRDPLRGNGWWQRAWCQEKIMPPAYKPDWGES